MRMIVDLTDYLWIVWLVFIFLFVIIELTTLEFTFLMIAAGSLGGLGANLLGWPWWVQIIVASLLSVVLLWTIRPLMLKTMRKGEDPTPSNVAALIQMAGRVVATVDDHGGLVKLANGETWTARLDESAEGATIAEGERIQVTRINGSIAVIVPLGRKNDNG